MRKEYSTEIGSLGIWDSKSMSFIDTLEKAEDIFVHEINMVRLMNEGRGVFWKTGGDGVFVVDVRINPKEELTDEEKAMSAEKVLDLKLVAASPRVIIGSPEVFPYENKNLENGYISLLPDIKEGVYKVDIYFIRDSQAAEDNKPSSEDKTSYVVILKEVDNNTPFQKIKGLPWLETY